MDYTKLFALSLIYNFNVHNVLPLIQKFNASRDKKSVKWSLFNVLPCLFRSMGNFMLLAFQDTAVLVVIEKINAWIP
jgi:hypothetical protein